MLSRTIKHAKRFNGETRTWYAYTEAEAAENGIEYGYWRDASRTASEYSEANPQYVLTDDKYVIPVFDICPMRGSVILKTPFGYYPMPRDARRTAEMIVVGKRALSENQDSLYRKSRKTTNAIVAQLAAHGLTLNEVLAMLDIAPQSDRERAIKRFYASKECNQMIREEVKNILRACDITEEKVIRMLLEAHEVAKGKRDASNMLRATENLVDMFGLKDKVKETTTQTIEIGSEVEDLERLESVKERLKLSQTTAKEGE